MICPKCHSEEYSKAGKSLGKQRYKCKKCGYHFVNGLELSATELQENAQNPENQTAEIAQNQENKTTESAQNQENQSENQTAEIAQNQENQAIESAQNPENRSENQTDESAQNQENQAENQTVEKSQTAENAESGETEKRAAENPEKPIAENAVKKDAYILKIPVKRARKNSENTQSFVQNMLDFIDKSPTCFHSTDNFAWILKSNGFEELSERTLWDIYEGGKYFVRRNDSSLIAFAIPRFDYSGFVICASHSDSPALKIKEGFGFKSGGICRLNVEKYGGLLLNPWFDRPLSVAGKVAFRSKNERKIESRLVDLRRPIALIPSLAPHLVDKHADSSKKIDFQKEMQPVFSFDRGKSLKRLVSEAIHIREDDILASDLFVYNSEKGFFWGGQREFIASPRLDDLECGYSSLFGFLDSLENLEKMKNVPIFASFDNEEVGSTTRQGAASTFLFEILNRISILAQKDEEEHFVTLAKSFMVSADNAHALNPAFADKSDSENRPFLNGGPVAKISASQKYTTDAISLAIFKMACENAKVPCQIFANNSNIAGGSTLGNLIQPNVSIRSVDAGLAQWAMHSPLESAGAFDAEMFKKVAAEIYRTTDFAD